MKIKCLLFALFVFGAAFLFPRGLSEGSLVNTQRFPLQNIDSVSIDYAADEIAVFSTKDEQVVLKEYMSIDKKEYYAVLQNESANKISIARGKRPFGLGTGILFNTFRARAELYIPEGYEITLDVKAASGKITIDGDYSSLKRLTLTSRSGAIEIGALTSPNISIDCRSGSVNIESIRGVVQADFRSGAFKAKNIHGAASITGTSGSLYIENMDGDIEAENTSGAVRCGVTKNAHKISLAASSGSVRLFLPKDYSFTVSVDVGSGSFKTPFQNALYSPVADKGKASGVIGENPDQNSVSLKATSGAVRVEWL